MKIAFLNIYNGVVDRGAETYVKELAKRLNKNHEVFVFQSGKANKNEGYSVIEIKTKLDFVRKNSIGNLARKIYIDYWSLKILFFTLRTIPVLFKHKFDVVVPVNGGWQPSVVRIVTWIMGKKMIISGQSGIGWDERNNLFCFPDRFIALSKHAEKWANKANPFVKTLVIGNGVDTDKFTQFGSKYKTHLKHPIVLCAAALTKNKRIDLAIKAVSKLEDVSLLVAGKGEEEKELRRLGLELLGERFEITSLPFDQMPSIYRTVDVFTIPSKSYFSFEIVAVEAMASNLPVVVNNDPIRKEIVGNAGILIDPENSESYVTAIKQALGKNWGQLPRKQAEKFDWNYISGKYEEMLKSI